MRFFLKLWLLTTLASACLMVPLFLYSPGLTVLGVVVCSSFASLAVGWVLAMVIVHWHDDDRPGDYR